MSKTPNSTVSESVQGTLVQRAGDAPDAGTVVEAITRTWQAMASQLEPVIGARGVAVLLARALHLTGKKFPWLAQAGPLQEGADLPTSLQARFAGRDAQEISQAGSALLVAFTELLGSLIGEPLTERLLASVWLDTAQPSRQESLDA